MRTHPYLHRGIAVVVIALFIIIVFAPCIHASDFFRKAYIGRIDDLQIEEYNNSYNYSFDSDNIRIITVFRDSNHFHFEFNHHKFSCGYELTGFRFRGILRPNFICGIFRPDADTVGVV
jgi:hypothetical protein